MQAAAGITKPIGPLASTAAPQEAPMPMAAGSESRARWPGIAGLVVARAKRTKARVVKNNSGASGVEARPPTDVQMQVAMARPPSSPTAGLTKIRPSCQVSRQVPIVSRAEPSRTPVSVRPQTAIPAMCNQLTSGGFSIRSRPSNVGTTQSSASSMATEQAAFFGSSSSHRGVDPSRGSSTNAATAATIQPWKRGCGMAWWGQGGSRVEPPKMGAGG